VGAAPIGSRGEDAAAEAYLRRGYRTLARNWRCPLGEIDLVLERRGTIVFCEVKTRRPGAFGPGYDAVTWRKRRKVRSLAEAFLLATGTRPLAVRFDVASVAIGAGRPSVEVFEEAF